MNIKLLSRIPFSELEKKVSDVPLLKARNPDGSQIFVYKDACISLRNISPDEVNPTTFYLLRKNLEFQRELRNYLLANYNTDSLALDGALELENVEAGERWTLMPPVVEVSEEDVKFEATRGDLKYEQIVRVKVPIINDGAHRVMLARQLGMNMSVVYINNIPPEHPFYAYPNPWNMVSVVESTPREMGEKKFYRRGDSYALYRNFGVLGCGAPRKVEHE